MHTKIITHLRTQGCLALRIGMVGYMYMCMHTIEGVNIYMHMCMYMYMYMYIVRVHLHIQVLCPYYLSL